MVSEIMNVVAESEITEGEERVAAHNHIDKVIKTDPKTEERKERWKLKQKQKAAERLDQFINDLDADPKRFDTIVTMLLNNRRFIGLLVKATSVHVISSLEAVKEQTKILDQADHLVVECFDIDANRDDEFTGERVILNWHGNTTAPIDDFREKPLKSLVTLFSERPDGFTDIIPINDNPSIDNINLTKKMITAIIGRYGKIENDRQYLLGVGVNPTLIENKKRLEAELDKRVDDVIQLEDALASGAGIPFK